MNVPRNVESWTLFQLLETFQKRPHAHQIITKVKTWRRWKHGELSLEGPLLWKDHYYLIAPIKMYRIGWAEGVVFSTIPRDLIAVPEWIVYCVLRTDLWLAAWVSPHGKMHLQICTLSGAAHEVCRGQKKWWHIHGLVFWSIYNRGLIYSKQQTRIPYLRGGR